MLHSFKFKNFYSFADEVDISLRLSKKGLRNNLSATSTTGQNINKVISVIGANASGKTNILKAISFLSWFISHSFSDLTHKSRIPLEPHFFSHDQASEFVIEFDLLGKLYKYALIATKERVLYEALFIKKTKFFSYLFKRVWNEKNNTYEVRQQGFGFATKEARKVRQNASFLSTALQYEVEESITITNAIRVLCNVGVEGKHHTYDNLLKTANLFHKTPHLEKRVSDILCKMDLGLSKVFTKMESYRVQDSPELKEQSFPVPYGVHQYKDKKKTLVLWKESSGTQKVYNLLRYIIPALESGGLAMIDELEADLHPDMLEPLIKLFINPETNPHNAQILFSTHSHEVMDLLNKEQIVLVEKNEACNSEAWRLDEVSGVRRSDNLYAKYRSGAYGAVPNI